MPDISAILGLPYLLPSQAQKHVTHNEALRLLDILVQLRAEELDADTPPAVPVDGTVFALGPAPTGAWAGRAGQIAAFVEGAWQFLTPAPGWRAWNMADATLRLWDGAAWILPDAAPDTLEQLGIATSADAVNRLAVASDAVLLTHAGAGHQLKINKSATGDTAALLFQSGFTGHAEMGLAGSLDFAVKTSEDGSTWRDALVAAAASGVVALPQGMTLGAGTDTLSTYDTGSWTPEAADAESGGAVASAGAASGRYIRIGDLVFACFELEDIDTTGLASGNALMIRGLPFAARSHSSTHATAPAQIHNVSFTTPPYLALAPGASALSLQQNISGSAPTSLSVSALTSGAGAIYGAISYRT